MLPHRLFTLPLSWSQRPSHFCLVPLAITLLLSPGTGSPSDLRARGDGVQPACRGPPPPGQARRLARGARLLAPAHAAARARAAALARTRRAAPRNESCLLGKPAARL